MDRGLSMRLVVAASKKSSCGFLDGRSMWL
jgi:hypothetical protein